MASLFHVFRFLFLLSRGAGIHVLQGKHPSPNGKKKKKTIGPPQEKKNNTWKEPLDRPPLNKKNEREREQTNRGGIHIPAKRTNTTRLQRFGVHLWRGPAAQLTEDLDMRPELCWGKASERKETKTEGLEPNRSFLCQAKKW